MINLGDIVYIKSSVTNEDLEYIGLYAITRMQNEFGNRYVVIARRDSLTSICQSLKTNRRVWFNNDMLEQVKENGDRY